MRRVRAHCISIDCSVVTEEHLQDGNASACERNNAAGAKFETTSAKLLQQFRSPSVVVVSYFPPSTATVLLIATSDLRSHAMHAAWLLATGNRQDLLAAQITFRGIYSTGIQLAALFCSCGELN